MREFAKKQAIMGQAFRCSVSSVEEAPVEYSLGGLGGSMVLSTEVKSYTSAIHPGSAGWLLFLLDFVSLLLPVTNEQDRSLASREWQALSSVWQQDSHSPISVSRLTTRCQLSFRRIIQVCIAPGSQHTHSAISLLLLWLVDPGTSQAWPD